MKLLITGIPGTGKTTFGNYLAEKHGYLHFDVEATYENINIALSDFLNSPRENKVITWGFMPGSDDHTVKVLQGKGFQMIWFDGDRFAARIAFNKRGTVKEELLDAQLVRIDGMDLASFNPVFINTFDGKGAFLGKDLVLEKIKESLA